MVRIAGGPKTEGYFGNQILDFLFLDDELKILKMKNLKFVREKQRWRAYDLEGRPVTLPECKLGGLD